jgi:hypothetical protein
MVDINGTLKGKKPIKRNVETGLSYSVGGNTVTGASVVIST